MTRHGDYYYMTLALGGTAGPPTMWPVGGPAVPPTGHMVVSARSKSIHGPWENSPYNPIIRTESAAEKWWSKGHATLVEGPGKSGWYMMYHGYENGFHALGRQALLAPIALVGTTAPGLNDLRATPVNAQYPGVEIHANMISSILDGSFKFRPDYASVFEAAQLVVLGLLLALALPVLAPAWSIALSLLAIGAAGA
eukprot:gene29643-36719_t